MLQRLFKICFLCLIQGLQINCSAIGSVYEYIEESLYPSPDVINWNDGDLIHSNLSKTEKFVYYSKNVIPAVTGISAATLGGVIYSFYGAVGAPIAATGYKLHNFLSAKDEKSFELEDSENFQEFYKLPKYVGFADSFFQSCGLGTYASATDLDGTCNWDKWLTTDHIELKDNQEFPTFFVDYLDDPTPLINLLNKLNVSAYRFSLERSVIEPYPGIFNLDAIEKYRNLFKLLKENGIEPWVTLHHFVEPEWFSSNSGFESLDNVDNFVEYACNIIKTFPEIIYWMTFNEPGVYAFQSYIRGVYPPGKSNDFETAAKVIRNLMIAHCKIYKAIKKDNPQNYKNVQIGITHQWLKFFPFNDNPIEKLACHQLSKVLHNSIFNFMKTGQLFIKVPGTVCVELNMDIAEWKTKDWFDFVGVQWYGFAKLKIGWNYGDKYPGFQTQNYTNLGITFGATDKAVMSFGPPVNPEDLEHVLQEAKELKIPFAITEIGCDTMIHKKGNDSFKPDEVMQMQFMKKALSIVANHENCIAFFAWTLLRGHLEWERGSFPLLGQVDLEIEEIDGSRRIIDTKLSPAALYLQYAYSEIKRLSNNN